MACPACHLRVAAYASGLTVNHWHRLTTGPVEGALYSAPLGAFYFRVLCPGSGVPSHAALYLPPADLPDGWDSTNTGGPGVSRVEE